MSDLLVSIRHAKPDDAEGLSRVFEQAWREAYQGIIPGVALERMLARRGPRWWHSTVSRGRPLAVLDIGQGIAGYVSYGRCRDRSLPAKGEIDELYLAPEYQGIGLGRRLFKAVRNDLADRDLERIVVWALADNERACAFYERMGGRSIAQVKERIGGVSLSKIAFLFR
ncbi:MAG TPA: GNAT family N-acetyltransferase [Microvirga sp.]|nr:GNAT family N-acetyltransferase [Microvirga sp.]